MFGLHNWVILFSLIYPCMLCHFMFLIKNRQRTWKTKRIKILLNMVASIFLGDVGVIWCTSRWWSPSNSYDCVWMYLILLYHYSSYNEKLIFLAKVSHITRILFATFDTIVQVQCDLAITRNTCGSISLLNCLNLFFKIKIG